jgi:hypothetical protein
MMPDEMTFQQCKRFIQVVKDYRDDIDGNDANTLIHDACVSAYQQLEPEQQSIVAREVQQLQDHYPRLSFNGALEVLASVAEFHNN